MLILRRFFLNIKQRFILWLHRQLEMIPRSFHAILDPSTQISVEGQIENLRGDKKYISVGANSYIRGRLITYAHAGEIQIGAWSYLGVRSEIWSMNSVRIGNRVLIAHDVNINDGSAHSMNHHERHAHFQQIMTKGHPLTWESLPGVKSAPIVIEDDVWISFGVTILPGVTIGARSVIAAGAIVTKDVPPDTLYRCEVHPIFVPISEMNGD